MYAHTWVLWFKLQVRQGVRERLKLASLATSMIILPRGSLSASMSRNTTGFLVGPEENSLAAAMPGELYLMRFFICSIAAQLRRWGQNRRPHRRCECLQVTSHGATVKQRHRVEGLGSQLYLGWLQNIRQCRLCRHSQFVRMCSRLLC